MDDLLRVISRKDVESANYDNNTPYINSLEEGQILYLPDYYLTPNDNDKLLLTDSFLDKRSKNISYDYNKGTLGGVIKSSDLKVNLQQFMHRYAMFAKHLVDNILSEYSANLIWGRTSFRPAEIKGRPSSKRKDDTRVHVDSFPSTPVNGRRILRVFCNINPFGEPRTWHVGEPFAELMQKFKPHLPTYNNFIANILKLTKATKSKRSAYDHYMLHLHNKMKCDDNYQNTLDKKRIEFPPNSTWLVYTDHVSHAALSGQFLLEQTFYIPVTEMNNPNLAPYSLWEQVGLI